MLITKDGVTFEVTHPTEIARLKRAGYREVKDGEIQAAAQAEAEKAIGTGSKTVVSAKSETPEPEPVSEPESDEPPKKGKAKK